MTHTTRSGNTYTNEEWTKKQREFAVKKSNQQIIEKMEKYAGRVMNEKGLNGDYLKDHLLEIREMLEYGRIKCSKDTANWLMDLADRFLDKCSELENVDPIG